MPIDPNKVIDIANWVGPGLAVPIDPNKIIDIANWVGPGLAVLILGVTSWSLWKLAINEIAYGKSVLRETMIVLASLSKSLEGNTAAIESLKNFIKENQK